MSCRCSDISDCSFDIGKLSEALSLCSQLSAIHSEMECTRSTALLLERKSYDLSEAFRYTFETNFDDCCCVVSDGIAVLKTYLSSKISNLQSELRWLQSEDGDWHEEQRRLKYFASKSKSSSQSSSSGTSKSTSTSSKSTSSSKSSSGSGKNSNSKNN